MKLDTYIFNLLYEHDCVIIPDFGGFVAERKPAQVNASKNILYPPSRRIAFNAALKNNDGLLAHHIAQEKQIGYGAACDEIKIYKSELADSLNAGNRCTVEKVGTLYFDAQKNIQFTSDISQNFLYDSYGLAMVHAPVKKSDEPVLAVHDDLISAEKKPGTIRWLKLVPAAAVFALILMIPKIIPRVNTELGNLMPATEQKSEPAEQPTAENNQVPEIKPDVAFAIEEESPVESETNSEVTPANNPADAETGTAQPQNNFYIIAGCFRIEENAFNLEADLKSKGFEAAIIGKNNAGLTMVSAASFSTLAEAKNNLSSFQNELADGAWVFKNRTFN